MLLVLMDTLKGTDRKADALEVYSPKQLGQFQASVDDGCTSQQNDTDDGFEHGGHSFRGFCGMAVMAVDFWINRS